MEKHSKTVVPSKSRRAKTTGPEGSSNSRTNNSNASKKRARLKLSKPNFSHNHRPGCLCSLSQPVKVPHLLDPLSQARLPSGSSFPYVRDCPQADAAQA